MYVHIIVLANFGLLNSQILCFLIYKMGVMKQLPCRTVMRISIAIKKLSAMPERGFKSYETHGRDNSAPTSQPLMSPESTTIAKVMPDTSQCVLGNRAKSLFLCPHVRTVFGEFQRFTFGKERGSHCSDS